MSKYRDRYGNPTIYALLGRNLTGEGNSVIVYGSQSSKLIWKKVA